MELNSEISFKYKTNKELKRALRVYYIFSKPRLSSFLQTLLKIALYINLPVKWAVKSTVFGHFVGGESLIECLGLVKRLAKENVFTVLDYSIESGNDEVKIQNAYNETIKSIEFASRNSNIPFAVFKPSALTFEWVLLNEKRDDYNFQYFKFKNRMESLFKLGYDKNVPIFVDAEEFCWQNVIDGIVEEGMRTYNINRPIVFHTLQMYRTDRLEYLNSLLDDAKRNKYFLGIKLVRGAYMEKERELAEIGNYPSPIYESKTLTDNAFNKALNICVENINIMTLINGTHNKESCSLLVHLMGEKKLDNNHKNIFFVQLYGMSDDISFNLASHSYNVAKYLPYGPIKLVMPYLMRRAEENSAVDKQVDNEYRMLKAELNRRKTNSYDD